MAGRARRPALSIVLLTLGSVVVACGPGAATAPTPSIAVTDQTSVPSPGSSAVASVTAVPSVPDPSTVAPSPPIDMPAGEAHLLAGIRPDAAIDCAPRRADLAARAIAGVECRANHQAVERVGFYLFSSESDLLATYFERLDAEGIEVGSGGCFSDEEGDTNYVPEAIEKTGPNRHACFINDAGRANYRATLPEALVYIGVLGTSRDIEALHQWAWLGNLDRPGGPTIWRNDDAP